MSVLASIAKRRDERVQDLHLDLPIPTWDGDLIARFEILPRKVVEKFATAKRSLDNDLNFIIRATRELYLLDQSKSAPGTRMEDNGDYVRIEDDETGQPVRWDTVLAAKLEHPDLETAKAVLLYCVKDNGLAVGGLAGKLITWMQNTDAEVAEALVGE